MFTEIQINYLEIQTYTVFTKKILCYCIILTTTNIVDFLVYLNQLQKIRYKILSWYFK